MCLGINFTINTTFTTGLTRNRFLVHGQPCLAELNTAVKLLLLFSILLLVCNWPFLPLHSFSSSCFVLQISFKWCLMQVLFSRTLLTALLFRFVHPVILRHQIDKQVYKTLRQWLFFQGDIVEEHRVEVYFSQGCARIGTVFVNCLSSPHTSLLLCCCDQAVTGWFVCSHPLHFDREIAVGDSFSSGPL